MTEFERLANEMGINVTTDKNNMYTGLIAALYSISIDIVLSDETINLSWEEKKDLIKKEFYKSFPYAK